MKRLYAVEFLVILSNKDTQSISANIVATDINDAENKCKESVPDGVSFDSIVSINTSAKQFDKLPMHKNAQSIDENGGLLII